MQLSSSCNAHKKTYDVIIVGGGLAGLSAALLLARVGIICAVIDPSTQLPSGRKLALNAHSVEIFKSLALWTQLAPLSVPIDTIQVRVGYHFPKLRLRSSAQQIQPAGHVIRIEQLAAVLLQKCQADPLIDLVEDQYIRYQKLPDSVQVQTQSGLSLRASLLIGADGVQSSVRSQAGCGWHTQTYHQKALVFEANFSTFPDKTALEWFIDEGTLAILPLPEGRQAVIWTAASGHLAFSLDKDKLERWVEECTTGAFGACSIATTPGQFPLAKSYSSDPFAQRVFLLGNAAHVLHPVAAQGFNLGLKNTERLVQALAKQRALGKDIGETALLSRAAVRTVDTFKTILFGSDLLASHASGQRWPQSLKAGVLLGLEYCPGVKSRITRWGMGVGE